MMIEYLMKKRAMEKELMREVTELRKELELKSKVTPPSEVVIPESTPERTPIF